MKKDYLKRILVPVLLIVFMISGTACGGDEKSSEDASWDPPRAEKETAVQLIERLSSEEEIGPGVEWSIIALARSTLAGEAEAQSIVMRYRDDLRLKTKQTKGILDPDSPTSNAKAAIAEMMTGGDPKDVEGYDLLEPLEDAKTVQEQGINAEIWALTASSVCDRELKTEDTYIRDILEMQDASGGITYDGETADPDITAMAIQALAPYRSRSEKIAESVDSARTWLSSIQNEDGGYGNAETTAQVILALSALGEDPADAKGFTGEGKDLFHGLMEYHVDDGFCHESENSADGMATEQALCALDAIVLAGNGGSFFVGAGTE